MPLSATIRAFFLKKKERRASITASIVKQPQSQQQQTENNSSKSSTVNSSTKGDSKDGLNFTFKDGRRYHNEAEVAYVLPNDYDELDRVQQQHWILRYALQCNFHAPVADQLTEGISVLDSGCGPGTWTLDLAEVYPKSKFHGIDASCIFPENIKPPNVEFTIGNIAKEIPFPDNSFDFIFQRLLFLGLTSDDWDNTLKELYRVLKPGGYIEFIEPDMTELENLGPQLKKVQDKLIEMAEGRNIPRGIAIELKNRIIDAGFDLKYHKIEPLKMNHTDKAGQLYWDDCRHAYRNLKPVMAQNNPEWESEEAYYAFIDECGKEAQELKTCMRWFVYYAQKPLH